MIRDNNLDENVFFVAKNTFTLKKGLEGIETFIYCFFVDKM